jgi:hypothetical protein
MMQRWLLRKEALSSKRDGTYITKSIRCPGKVAKTRACPSRAEALRASYQLAGRASSGPVCRRQDAEAAVGLLIHAHKVRQDSEEVEARLDPAKRPLGRRKVLDVAHAANIANTETTQVSQKACVGDQGRDNEDHDQGCGPGGNLVRTNGKVRVGGSVSSHRFHTEEEEDPDAGTHNYRVAPENVQFHDEVEKSGEGRKSFIGRLSVYAATTEASQGLTAKEQSQRRYRAVLALEPFDQGRQCDNVENRVDKVEVNKRIRRQSVRCRYGNLIRDQGPPILDVPYRLNAQSPEQGQHQDDDAGEERQAQYIRSCSERVKPSNGRHGCSCGLVCLEPRA